ncbi:rhodanese-like domain-containing protein [Thalassotalea piscium]|uniref:Rhodanese-related sulfurtransferase n=1 Tax=Thalassotalea piscium TaxID=1230533 RepID=A0A7X0NF02_9GAMM|nr:rhodanese-like domain-containing protein [Thalassotalea piscium]MBB6542247.1 rhodanese-related sulfurtransferase [Thalassotalea piscium]
MISPITELVKEAKKNIDIISVAQAKQLMEETPCLLLDVREASEVASSAVSDSLAIPRGVLEMQITSKCNDPQMQILVHCQSGGRACLAAEQLLKMGYKNVKAITATHQEMCEHFNQC